MIRLIVAVLCALLVSLAGGERAAFAAPPASAKSADNVDEAVRLAEEGKAAFKAGNYNEAAEKFFAAYEISKRPALLYNAARAYQEAKEYRLARNLYGLYKELIETTDPKGLIEAEKRLMECEAAEEAIAKAKADAENAKYDAEDAKAGGPGSMEAPQDGVKIPNLPVVVVERDGTHREVKEPEPIVVSRFEPARLNSWKTWSGASALAVGVSLLVTGQQFGVSANERVIRSESDIAAYQSDFKTGRALYYTGAGVIAAGVGMLIWASVDSFVEEEEVVVAPTAAPGLVGATLTARF